MVLVKLDNASAQPECLFRALSFAWRWEVALRAVRSMQSSLISELVVDAGDLKESLTPLWWACVKKRWQKADPAQAGVRQDEQAPCSGGRVRRNDEQAPG